MNRLDKWISKHISTPSGFVLAGAMTAIATLYGLCWLAYMIGGLQ